MSSLFTQKKLVIATHNAGKVKEFAVLINHDDLTLISAAELNLPEPEETGLTFAENAQLKSNAAAIASNLPALADDSGLSVEGLDGQPGIYSARWADNKDFAPAFDKIKKMLEAKNINPNGARAAFICVLALTLPDGKTKDGDRHPASLCERKTIVAQGKTEGSLCFPPRGLEGFGYDPIFIPDGESRSFGEMTQAEKNAYSHRAKAVAELKKYF
jgi:XTP/dITP diphosphohydrolase